VRLERDLDDTFATRGGMAELTTLVVAAGHRRVGTGRRLLAAVEAHAGAAGIDTVRIAVMAGNDAARVFYERVGYRLGEHVLYRRDTGRVPSGP
jgi:ribosomal protein S18 acetylase RimI-like enzyme